MLHLKTIRYFLLLPLCFFLSCGPGAEKETPLPPGILSREEIVKVLRDFALAESAANMNVKGTEPRKNDSVYAFNPLKENNIRPSQYDSSLSFYVNQPELYKKIYEEVLVALSEFQAKRNGTPKDSVEK